MIVDGRAGFRFAAAEIHEVLLAHGGPGADRLTMKTAGSRLLGIQEPLRWFAASLRRSFRFRRDQVQDHGSPASLDECVAAGDRGGSRPSIRGGVQPRQSLTNRDCSRSGPEGTDQALAAKEPGDNSSRHSVPARQNSAYLASNPLGRAPTLVTVTHGTITEAPVVLSYIADVATDHSLLPAIGTPERYEALRWMAYISSTVHPAFGRLWRAARFCDDPDCESSVEHAAAAQLADDFAYIEKHMSNRR
jgi:hypothetical protein